MMATTERASIFFIIRSVYLEVQSYRFIEIVNASKIGRLDFVISFFAEKMSRLNALYQHDVHPSF
jgi:hypothetical protein